MVVDSRPIYVIGEDSVAAGAEYDVDKNECSDCKTLDASGNRTPPDVLRSLVAECCGDGDISLEQSVRSIKNTSLILVTLIFCSIDIIARQ